MVLTGEAKTIYAREWVRRRRLDWFADKVCAHCGSKNNLELDHIDPADKVTHKIWSWSDARRSEELAKCQALCESCHKKKTSQEQRKTYCIRGHLLSEGYVTASGRQCRQCALDRHRRNREAKRDAKRKG